MKKGKTTCLFGDSGSGKTTQLGELALDLFERTGKKTRLHTCDMGGYLSIDHLIEMGIMEVDELGPGDDPWVWINTAVTGDDRDDIGAEDYDSGTSMGEALLTYITKSDDKIGTQKTQRFTASKGINIGFNNENHYGLVQSFLLDCIWKSTFLSRGGKDVNWTFSVHRGEKPDDTPILGPKLAGKALTSAIPKWFNHCFRLTTVTSDLLAPIHRLYIQEKSELMGMGMSFGNARYPLGATTELPLYIEPASVVEAFRLIEKGKEEAKEAIFSRLGNR